jgi:hypothetical protein
MAIEAQRTGGQIGATLLQKAIAEGYEPSGLKSRQIVKDISTVPTHTEGEMVYDSLTGRTEYQPLTNLYVKVPGAGLNYPSAEHSAVYVPGETWLNTVTGQTYTTQKSRGGILDNIVGGGSPWTAQAGVLSTERNAAVTRSQDWAQYPEGDERGIIQSMSVPNWHEVNADWRNTTKVGANLYGMIGGVPLDSRVLTSVQGNKSWNANEIVSDKNNSLLYTGTLPTTGLILGGVPQFTMRAPLNSGNLVNYVTPAGMNYEMGDDQLKQNK